MNKQLIRNYLVLLFLFFISNFAYAQRNDTPSSFWTAQEVFVWEKLIKGEIANLSEYRNIQVQNLGNSLSTEKPTISKKFIEDILFEDSYAKMISRHGIRIIGARFIEELDFVDMTISKPIYLMSCDFEKSVSFVRGNLEKFLSFDSSKFIDDSKLDLRRIRTSRSVELSRIIANQILLVGANIEGMLDLRGAEVINTLNMRRISVSLSLLLRESNDNEVSQYNTVILHDAEVGGDLVISNSQFKTLLDLTSAQINGEFRLGSNLHKPAIWGQYSKLILRNASVGSFQDGGEELKNWPESDLIGFTYSNLGGLLQAPKESILNRDIEWFNKWLKKQPYYSPQPYNFLANILHDSGFETKSIRINYIGKNEECRNARMSGNLRQWFNLSSQWLLIGYGYYPLRSIYWIILFMIIGVLVKGTGKYGFRESWSKRIFYSFDLLIPIVKLNKKHSLEDLEGLGLYYFYFHKIVGFVLASYLIAGLSGLTK